MRRDLQRRLDALAHTAQVSEFQRDVAKVSNLMDELSDLASGGDGDVRKSGFGLAEQMENSHGTK
ncbi:hypothetical protein [Halomonas urumqiensis]|uniref:Uncharacterized protein n=1 Tax=Halomonas urumqiensis TaxID=1684789 RepID=A0A2N7UF59_9GAMM|nr:hypothetical protein [Halomonas urumqiensis]PMR79099.1 hypothetical protein C1H70_12385 [Halomonas urumqiensis]PTB03773.1 hypothetical protein C6V82_04670 [Halomonas urumqiensis]GHE20000.1 hypothetical protein GCM10017767_05210 [Halomonas urumqiensis]